MRERYFDNAATTPMDPRVLREMAPFFEESFGNAHSPHAYGRAALDAVDRARVRVADAIGAEDPSQVYFTSGATEADNWVLDLHRDSLAVSPFEHAAVREPAVRHGAEVLANVEHRLLPPRETPELVSVMSVNNEIGTRWDVRDFAASGARIHADATQALGKVEFDVAGLDYASFSAHKLYGPKGVGALFARDAPFEPLLEGGGQEYGLRGGTLNVPGIVGFGACAAIAMQEIERDQAHAVRCREALLVGLSDLSDWRILGGPHVSPFILGLTFLGVQGETLVVEADAAGYAISSRSACSSGATHPSHVLRALELESEWERGAIRIGFGRFSGLEAAAQLGVALARIVQRLRALRN